LNHQIDQGNANLTILPRDRLPGVIAKVREWEAERDRLQKRLERIETGADRRDAEETLRKAEAYLWRLRDALTEGDPYHVREVLHELVDRVGVRFEHRETAKQTRCLFSGGALWLKGEWEESMKLGGAR
jgi:hypothetical protein